MSTVAISSSENFLLAMLPPEERQRLACALEPVELPLSYMLEEAEEPLAYVWFLRSGVACSVSRMMDGAVIELATTGREGFVGIAALMGAPAGPHTSYMQVPGRGDRLAVGTFRRMLGELPSLQPLLLRYSLALFTQVAQAAACNRLHAVEARCARWLLMTHDRVDGDSFPMTQEFLGHMLGVTRPSVSVAAGMLQKAGYIHYVRGVMEIVDRAGLEGASCECYDVIRRQFRRLLEPS